MQTLVNFNVAFLKEFALAVIRESEKEETEIVDVSDDDDDDVMFCGKYPLHPRERLKRYLKEKLEDNKKMQ